MCSTCKAVACTSCMITSLKHRMADPTAPILCAACRTPVFPSLAQVMANDTLLTELHSVDHTHLHFWRVAGCNAPPPIIHKFVLLMYGLTALERARQLDMVENALPQVERVRTLRPTAARASFLGCVLGGMSDLTDVFASVDRWVMPSE